MDNGNLVKTDSGLLCPTDICPQLGEREQILHWCVGGGTHPNEDGWFLLFKFPNGLTATVVWTLESDGIEVGVRDGDWLIDVIPRLSGEDVVKALRSVMLRSLA